MFRRPNIDNGCLEFHPVDDCPRHGQPSGTPCIVANIVEGSVIIQKLWGDVKGIGLLPTFDESPNREREVLNPAPKFKDLGLVWRV